MKRLTATATIFSIAALASGSALAGGANPYDKIGTDNPAFEDSGMGSIQNSHNTALRFGSGGRVAIPGEGGSHANANAAVSEYDTGGSGGLVAPPGRTPDVDPALGGDDGGAMDGGDDEGGEMDD